MGPSISARREAARARRRHLLGLEPHEALTLVPAGLRVSRPGTDAFYTFRQHDDFTWATGLQVEGGVLARDGECWTLFAPVPDVDDRVWHGSPPDLATLAEATGVEEVQPREALQDWLLARTGRAIQFAGHPDFAERCADYDVQPTAFEKLAFDPEGSARLGAALVARRRLKDDVELGWLREAARATAAGHAEGMRSVRPGMTEQALCVEIEAGFRRAGAQGPAYDSIVAGGPNAAVLHAAPTERPFAEDDLVLVDAGAEVAGYDGDVTRVFPAGGRFSARARDLYAAVFRVQEQAVAGVRAGVEFRDLHMQASVGLAEGLVDLGVLRGRPEDLVAQDAHAVFFPHGLGHLLGLATHDVGGYAEGRTRSTRPGLRYLRADVTLAPGMVLTIEPGLYFIPALLDDPQVRETHAARIDFEAAAAFVPVGGVRIEDDVHVTDGEPEVLSAGVPKSLSDLET